MSYKRELDVIIRNCLDDYIETTDEKVVVKKLSAPSKNHLAFSSVGPIRKI